MTNDLKHRQSTAVIRLLRADGTPAANETLRIDQTESDFLLGCGAFDAVELFRAKSEEEKAFLTQRLDNWMGLFNYGTLPFYWGRYETEEGKPAFTETMQGAQYMKAHGVKLKGHPLCWHTVCADWLMQYPDEVILEKQLSRIHREVTAFSGVIDRWDVINEMVIMPEFDRYDNAVTRLCRHYGREGLGKAVFTQAHADNPGAELLINDFNTSEKYAELIGQLLDAGVPISTIGIQSHQHQGYWGAEKVHEVLDRFSRFGLPIHFTENTLISGHLMPPEIVDLNDYQIPEWPTTPEGEQRQAEQTLEMLNILFSHPLVQAMTIWDATDGCWLGAPSGVMRRDNTPKPVYYALQETFRGKWRTHLETVTDENGIVQFTGFKGMYDVKSVGGSASFHLGEDGEQVVTLG